MKTYFKRFLRNFDYPLFFAFLMLTLFGLVMIYSASMVWAVSQYELGTRPFFKDQILNLKVAYPYFYSSCFFSL